MIISSKFPYQNVMFKYTVVNNSLRWTYMCIFVQIYHITIYSNMCVYTNGYFDTIEIICDIHLGSCVLYCTFIDNAIL